MRDRTDRHRRRHPAWMLISTGAEAGEVPAIEDNKPAGIAVMRGDPGHVE